ncbi:rod shape-determining protein MreC [Janibacter sp. YIM B02568]|uniref:rod shape-determining protein MreC n=1 Tax=Janibacter endophyticus TaxID=2806261 RepID=UPI00194F9C12|nr:rod shape-determining protein MreC [Janibacter endophyticus]MBM6546760.1 rod shape-determining protein MreC [Janibacter endophyticus]
MRRILAALLVVTVLVLLADLAGGPTGPVRSAGSAVVGPLLRAASPTDGDPRDAELTRLRLRVAELEDERSAADQESRLDALADEHELTVVPARVVAVGARDARGSVRVTLDVGSRDGVRPDRAVVGPDGLVGRVVAVSSWTTDVELLGAAGTRVGVRVGAGPGVLGELTGSDPTVEQGPGELAVSAVQEGRLRPGDVVRTLGSADGVPYPAGLPVGEVTTVADQPGRLTQTAAVRPFADLSRVDVVGVITDEGR